MRSQVLAFFILSLLSLSSSQAIYRLHYPNTGCSDKANYAENYDTFCREFTENPSSYRRYNCYTSNTSVIQTTCSNINCNFGCTTTTLSSTLGTCETGTTGSHKYTCGGAHPFADGNTFDGYVNIRVYVNSTCFTAEMIGHETSYLHNVCQKYNDTLSWKYLCVPLEDSRGPVQGDVVIKKYTNGDCSGTGQEFKYPNDRSSSACHVMEGLFVRAECFGWGAKEVASIILLSVVALLI